jgi:hypothetical protein
MDIVQESQMSFTIEEVRQVLRPTGDGVLRQRSWLQASLTDPVGFATALFRDAAAQAESPPKSQLGAGYDLFYDAVVRHALGPAAERPCLLHVTAGPSVDPERSLQALTYSQLYDAACVLADSWQQRGAGIGESLCILYPLGPELLVALCAALKLGLVVAVLPPLGADFLGKRLRAMQPRHLVTARRYLPLLRESVRAGSLPLEDAILPAPPSHGEALAVAVAAAAELRNGVRQGTGVSHTYAPRSAALLCFSPLRDPAWVPQPVAAQAAYLGALDDGLVVGLHHGHSTLAAPEHAFLQYQPMLLLTTLLHGATFLHVSAAALAELPQRARSLPTIDVLLLTARLRDRWLETRGRPLHEVRCCVTQACDGPEDFLWQEFIERARLRGTPFLSWHYDATCAGALLFSLRKSGQVSPILYPAPGRPFLLADPRIDDAPAQGPNGILRPLPGACGLLLYEHAGGYLYGGTRSPSRAGTSHARDEVEEVVAALPYVAGAAMVTDPSDRGTATLLVFVGPHLRKQSRDYFLKLEQEIRERLRSRLGVEYVPTHVQVLACLPRRNAKGIELSWCEQQLRTGQLARRASDPVLGLIDELSFACHRVATPVGRIALLRQKIQK